MSRAQRPVAALLATAALAGSLAACGGGGDDEVTVDHTVVETAIETSVARQQRTWSVVACPTDVEAVRGRRFRCLATIESGRQVPVTVTVRDARGTVDFRGFEGYVDGRPVGAGG